MQLNINNNPSSYQQLQFREYFKKVPVSIFCVWLLLSSLSCLKQIVPVMRFSWETVCGSPTTAYFCISLYS